MKVIDLLNKIANGEEVPERIKYLIYEYTYNDKHEEYQRYKNGDIFGLGEDWKLDTVLCEEVEVIEEDKKIEQLNTKHFHKKQRQLARKINEIIDKINEGE